MKRAWVRKNKTLNDNVFDQISRIEDGGSVNNEDIKVAEESVTTTKIIFSCILTTVFLSVIHLICNHASNFHYKNELWLMALNKAFHSKIVIQTVLFSTGASTTVSVLLISRSNGAFARFLPPLIKWTIFAMVPPSWFYVLVYNTRSLSESLLCQNIWVLSQAIAYFFPIYSIAGVIHIFDTDRIVWSRTTFFIYCLSLTLLFGLIAITNTALKLSHDIFLFANGLILIVIFGIVTSGSFNWFRAIKRNESVKMRTRNKLISIFVASLGLFIFFNCLVDMLSILIFSPGNDIAAFQICLFTINCLSSSLISPTVLLFFAKSLIEQQSDALEQVVVHHAEVFEKPMARTSLTEEEYVQVSLIFRFMNVCILHLDSSQQLHCEHAVSSKLNVTCH